MKARRRTRIVPRIVFELAAIGGVVPALGTAACGSPQHPQGVAQMAYPPAVAQMAYPQQPPEPLGVAAPAYSSPAAGDAGASPAPASSKR